MSTGLTEEQEASNENPQIIHQMVYQSVEAPQIEPLIVQERQEDPENPVFKSYDLVKGKPAGVLIKIKYHQQPRICFQTFDPHKCLGKRNFNLRLQIKDQFIVTKCVPVVKTEEGKPKLVSSETSSTSTCSFSSQDFSPHDPNPIIFKFVEITTELIDSIELDQYLKQEEMNIYPYYLFSILGKMNDTVIKKVDTENSNIPIRLNIVELEKEPESESVILNEVKVSSLDFENDLSLGNCKKNIKLNSANEFCLNVIELPTLKLGFTRIIGKNNNCNHKENDPSAPNGYLTVSPDKIQEFIHSAEVTDYLPTMFPLVKVTSNLLITSKNQDFIPGNCNTKVTRVQYAYKRRIPKEEIEWVWKRRVKEWIVVEIIIKIGEWIWEQIKKIVVRNIYEMSEGLIMDIAEMEFERREKGYSNLFAIVPKEYFLFHKLEEEEIYGFILVPFDIASLFIDVHKWDFLGAVAFIREDQINKGTVSHELAHLLGQRRELYEEHEYCQQFRGSKSVPCRRYKIPRALDVDTDEQGPKWNFVTDKFSIMGPEQGITKLWLDRETYQRTFSVLAKIYLAIQDNIKNRRLSHSSKQASIKQKILISGFYNREENNFMPAKPRIHETNLTTVSFKGLKNENLPLITFQLKNHKRNYLLKEIQRPVPKMNLSFLLKKESGEVDCEEKPFDFSYALAAFNFPENEKVEDLQVLVLDPKGEEIFSTYLQNESQ